MAITLTTTPTYALPGDAVPLTATVSTAANFVRLWCTDAPNGSALKDRLLKENVERVEILPPKTQFPGGIFIGKPFEVQLDRGGRYTFVGQEYTIGATTTGGGYSNDPQGYASLTAIGAEQTLYVYLGQRMTQRIGSSAYGLGSLLVHVWNNTIRETTVAIHGVASPAIINTTTPRALAAASASGVQTQLDAIKNAAVSVLAPNLQTLVAEMVSKIPDHFNNANAPIGTFFHGTAIGGANPDTVNGTEIQNLSTRCSTPTGMAKAAQILSGRLRLHMGNGPDGSTVYHEDADYTNALISDGGGSDSDPAGAISAIADVYRAYEAHRADATSHALADTFNTLTTAPGPLLLLHKEFLAAMTGLSPAAAGGAQTATTVLSSYGFRLE